MRGRGKAQIANITNERIATESMNINRIIEEGYEQLYIHKFDNVDEIDQFLYRDNLPKLREEELDNLNQLAYIY